ncbi:Transcription factor T-box, partial [Trinorchestia longiramus]
AGRRMFPQLQFKVQGLKERVLYAFSVRFEQLDNHRYKYVNGEWMQGGRPEPAPPAKSYAHSSSPNFGDRLMGGLISYSGIKLTNNGGHKKKVRSGEDDRKEVLVWLNSLHRYVPYLNIHKVDDNQEKLVASYKITVCEFIAVTA